MAQSEERLEDKQEAAIGALLSTSTIVEAADLCSVSRSTLHRWLNDPAFQRRYQDARRAVDQAIAVLQRGCAKVAQVLCTLVDSGGTPPNARVAAARAVLDFAIGGTEIEDSARAQELRQSSRP